MKKMSPLKYSVKLGKERVPIIVRPGNTTLLTEMERLYKQGEREHEPSDTEKIEFFEKVSHVLLRELFGTAGAQKVGAYYDWQPLEIGAAIIPLVFRKILPALEAENKKTANQLRRWSE